MSFAFIFPGQGSQSVGMLASLAASDPVVQTTFEEASATLGFDLWNLVQKGPEEALNATERTQPAMLAAGVATWRLWQARGGKVPAVVAGHSLGEFTALVCARALDFATAVSLVAERGRLMQQAVPAGTGAMAAVLGLEDEIVEQACQQAAHGAVVEAVNFNAPGQVVIAGQSAAVARAIEICKKRGAKRAMPLPVSVPSHSALMRTAATRFGQTLQFVSIRAPQIAYISAMDAERHRDPEDIRELLTRQMARPVRWTDTVRALAKTGIAQLIECGPGKVLTGLNRRIERNAGYECLALEDPASLDAALKATQGLQHA